MAEEYEARHVIELGMRATVEAEVADEDSSAMLASVELDGDGSQVLWVVLIRRGERELLLASISEDSQDTRDNAVRWFKEAFRGNGVVQI
jgi:hypothetical protein